MYETVHNVSYDIQSTSSSDNSTECLSLASLSPDSNYLKFERYSKQLIRLGREVIAKDHTCDRLGQRFLNTDRYLRVHDKVRAWVCLDDNAAVFADSEAFFYLAQIAIAMQTIEIMLALPHQPIRWPGANPGPSLCWPGVTKQEVYRRFDELIFYGRDLEAEALPWAIICAASCRWRCG